MKINIVFLISLLLFNSRVYSNGLSKIEKLDWNGIDVIWLEDNSFPTFSLMVYFGDGALSDAGNEKGMSAAMFSFLDLGTKRFSQSEISDSLEFYGISPGANVTHEYSTYGFSGLAKDAVPATKMICHLFQNATFPKKEIKKEVKRIKSSLNNMLSNHSALASRVFREESLKGSGFSYPVTGKLKDLKRIEPRRLNQKLNYFNSKVKKRIYMTGPKSLLALKSVFNQDCKWKGQEDQIVRKVIYNGSGKTVKKSIILIPVPKANQAQVRLGRTLTKDELINQPLMEFSSGFLGGGFTSKLMREVRVKRGLSYSISAYASGQKGYGRAGISTFTKNKTIFELLDVIKNTISMVGKGEFTSRELERARGHIKGKFYFTIEQNDKFLGKLLFSDHIGKDYSEIFKFQDKVAGYSKDEVVNNLNNLFDWEKQTIVVVGNKNLMKDLKKLGPVVIKNYKDYL
jgi:zinc protease